MSFPDWEEELAAQKSLLNIGRQMNKRRVGSRSPMVVVDSPAAGDSVIADGSPGFKDKNWDHAKETTPSLKGDWSNVTLLLVLYILQGIPLGLSGSIPMILSSRHVSYHDQAFFSLVFWPFSLKLLWAPIVDSLYSKKFGRRKSWLIPTQYLIGIFMLVLSVTADSVLDRSTGGSPNIVVITGVFFILNFLASIQDIATDGWALSLLRPANVGYASTCNSVGQTAGYFIGNVLFLAFESPDFCNKYIRSVPQAEGILTLPGYLWFWGLTFVACTTVVWVIKREKDDRHDASAGIYSAYGTLLNILKLPSVLRLSVVLLTAKVSPPVR